MKSSRIAIALGIAQAFCLSLMVSYGDAAERVLLAADRGNGEPARVEIIAGYDGHKFFALSPAPGPNYTAEKLKILRAYFPAGRRYPVFFGGAAAGIATIREAADPSWESLFATAHLRISLREAASQRRMLAGDVARPHTLRRRTPTAAELAALHRLAASQLRKRGSLSPALRFHRTAVVEMEHGGPVLVGTGVAGPSPAAHIFLIARRSGNAFAAAVANYWAGESVNTNTVSREDFLDNADLDGDGVDEIVTITTGYESWEYTIYRRDAGGRWKSIFSGGGGGQ